MFLGFGRMSYTYLVDGRMYGFMWALCSILFGYQIVIFLRKRKNDSWNTSYVVADDRILRKIINSLAISYIVALGFLVISTVGLINGFFTGHPVNFMVGAIISSIFVFMVSQIVQQFIN